MTKKNLILVLLLMLVYSFQLYSQGAYVNYAEALQKSIYFYDAEKCGFTGTHRLEWRGPCHLEDSAIALTPETTNLSSSFINANKAILDPDGDGFMNLIGGFHDAGDHVQFGLPQGYSASTLAWGLYEFKQAFIDTGNYDHMLEILQYFTDFFLRCTFKDASGNVVAYCYQTGDGSVDHAYWGPPELQDPEGLRAIGQNGITYKRPGWFASSETPGSDVCAQAAATLAAMYLILRDEDAAYAETCLENAEALYAFAVKYRGCADSGGYYGSDYDFDELSWAATWLYEATNDMAYIDDIASQDGAGNNTGYLKRLISTQGDTWINIWVHCWDAVWSGAFIRLSILFPDNDDFDDWARWNLEFWSGGSIPHENESMGGGYLQYSPGGFGVINTWGSARYNTAAQVCALIYGKHHNRTDFVEWARGQMNYIMGDNPLDKSYIVGYGNNWVKHPHHRAAHGSFTNSMVDPVDHRHTLWGALASGPDGSDNHIDLVSEYSYNEVAVDYNAGFVGALAGLYDFYGRDAGHEPVPDFPPPESDDVQMFWMDARIEQENIERTQVTLQIHGTPIHLPAPLTGVTCRYFFDISELVAVGQTIDDVTLVVYYDEMSSQYGGSVAATGPLPWDAENNIYYAEFDWSDGGIIGKRDLQFGLYVTQASDWKSYWDPTNDYSREGIAKEFADTKRVPIYYNGELKYGAEPGNPVSTTAPTTGPTAVPTATPTPGQTAVPTATPTPGPAGITGDVNDDGTVDIVDALLTAQYYVDLNPAAFNPDNADTNCDGSLDIIDALLIAQYYVGLIAGFC
ncbi:MAG: glycoside hydrolase family 9 protein [Spirochaetales bacterium]|nr:glycoside hydrolase family 9 protein [Spirochaetales bacterium]